MDNKLPGLANLLPTPAQPANPPPRPATKSAKNPPPWASKPVTGEMLMAAIQLCAGRSNAPETLQKIMSDMKILMDKGDPTKAAEMLKPEKRARGRPRLRPDDSERKHRDLGSYNLFVMKAQNVAGSDVRNHRAFMALIGSFWKAMDQATRDSFNETYKGLLDTLNTKKKAGEKFDFAHELKVFERDNELDAIDYFRGFMSQVKQLPPPPSAAGGGSNTLITPVIPTPDDDDDDDDDEDDDDEDDDDDDDDEDEAPKKKSRVDDKKKKKGRA